VAQEDGHDTVAPSTTPCGDGGSAGVLRCCPVIGKPKKEWPAVHGGFYAPYVVERFTKVVGSELHLYYVLSTWNPYVVVLMKSRFRVE